MAEDTSLASSVSQTNQFNRSSAPLSPGTSIPQEVLRRSIDRLQTNSHHKERVRNLLRHIPHVPTPFSHLSLPATETLIGFDPVSSLAVILDKNMTEIRLYEISGDLRGGRGVVGTVVGRFSLSSHPSLLPDDEDDDSRYRNTISDEVSNIAMFQVGDNEECVVLCCVVLCCVVLCVRKFCHHLVVR